MMRTVLPALCVLLGGCTPSAFLAGTVLAAGIYDAHYGGLGFTESLSVPDSSARRAAPPMAADRKVIEVDCSKPLPETGANIRCR